jgi:hypothetical protein
LAVSGVSAFAGLGPGEIVVLRRNRITAKTADIQERVYRGKLDTPKTHKSVRLVALSDKLIGDDLQDWLSISPSGTEALSFLPKIWMDRFRKITGVSVYAAPDLRKKWIQQPFGKQLLSCGESLQAIFVM